MISRKFLDNVVGESSQTLHRSRKSFSRKHKSGSELTLGQRLADAMANTVGSWSFLLTQTGILVVWIGLNVLPGYSHWDPAPFILLNLVFSFASAYTAPVVLMSQNRMAELDRQNAAYNHQVNLKSGQDIEWLHDKVDHLMEQQLAELTQMVKKQQQSLNELKAVVLKAQTGSKLSNDVVNGKYFNYE